MRTAALALIGAVGIGGAVKLFPTGEAQQAVGRKVINLLGDNISIPADMALRNYMENLPNSASEVAESNAKSLQGKD